MWSSTVAKRHVASLDIGTTNVRCCVYDDAGSLVASALEPVVLHGADEQFASEIRADELWHSVCTVASTCFQQLPHGAQSVAAMGIATHRNTFTVWNAQTGVPLRPFITWKDTRCAQLVDTWNKSYTFMLINFVGSVLYLLTRKCRFIISKMLRLMEGMLLPRLLWLLQTEPEMRGRIDNGEVRYGCVDAWLLHQLSTGGQWLHSAPNDCGSGTGIPPPAVLDASLASCTGMFDVFQHQWATLLLRIMGAPLTGLPRVVPTVGRFATCHADLFGAAIPITAVMGDQQSAAYGCGCVHEGDVMISLGTGAFVDVNTGSRPIASLKGPYPIIGWQLNDNVDSIAYLFEASSNDIASVINWAVNVGIISDLARSSDVAKSVPHSAGVYFVPAFGGLQSPENDPHACGAFVGLTAAAQREHLVHAVLQAVAFRACQLCHIMLADAHCSPQRIVMCGGVSCNDFICDQVASVTRRTVHRVDKPHLTAARGAAMLAAQSVGLWLDTGVPHGDNTERVFEPCHDGQVLRRLTGDYQRWLDAVQRTLKWYA